MSRPKLHLDADASQKALGEALSDLIRLLNRALTETDAEEWIGQVRWLSDWKYG